MTIITVTDREQALLKHVAYLCAERDELKATLSKVYRQQAEDLDEASDVLEHVDKERIADRTAMRLALDALVYHVEQTRPIEQTSNAITALSGRLETK